MKNIIRYYYNLEPDSIHQQDNRYKFNINKINYILFIYEGSKEELEEKYKIQEYLKKIKIHCHEIIHNKFNELLTNINNKKYVLIRLTIKNRIININDITLLSNIIINPTFFKYISKTEWKKLWEIKNDFIEYQINQLGKKYTSIRESCDYYIGLAENCISLLANNIRQTSSTSICHERIQYNTNTDYFYNPLYFIIDKKVRDIAEYLKKTLYEEKYENKVINNYIFYNNLSENDILLLFIRIIYPSTYFDLYENLVENMANEKELLKIINNSNKIEQNIKNIYREISTKIRMPNIEWLRST